MTVMVPTEWYVNGEAYYAMTALPAVDTENLGILTCKERKMIDSGLEQLVRHDETLWSSIRGRRPSLPPGCRVFLMVLTSIMFFFLGQFARDMDVSVSFSNNQIHEARTQEDRENLNVQMEKDSPWIVVYRSPSHVRPRRAPDQTPDEVPGNNPLGAASSIPLSLPLVSAPAII